MVKKSRLFFNDFLSISSNRKFYKVVNDQDTMVWGHFYRKAGGRFTEDPAPEMTRMRDETIPLKGIHLFDKAHVVMLTEQGILDRGDGKVILEALLEMEGDGFEYVRNRVGGGGHSGEAYLIEKLGMEIGGQIHLGRSSADLIAVTIRIEERDCIIDLLSGLNRLNRGIVELAKHHLKTVMPAYTHFQQAQPITFGHYLLSWVYGFLRDFNRFHELYHRINASPAGAAIVSGSPFPIRRDRVAELLGFGTIIENTRDAIFGYDVHLELFSMLAILNNTLARFCADLYIWSSSEFDLIELKDRFCGTSSVNPCKKNPQALEQIFSLAAAAVGRMTTAFSVDRMPSESWEIQWRVWSQELWSVLTKTIHGLDLVLALIESSDIHSDRMETLTKTGWICSSDLAASIVREKQLPWRIAHQIVARLVRISLERKIPSTCVTSDLLDEVGEIVLGKKLLVDQKAIDEALDPLACIVERRVTGGPAPEEVNRQIGDSMTHLRSNESRVDAMVDSLNQANEKLRKAVHSIIDK